MTESTSTERPNLDLLEQGLPPRPSEGRSKYLTTNNSLIDIFQIGVDSTPPSAVNEHANVEYVTKRPVYDQIDFDEAFDGGRRPARWTSGNAKKAFLKMCGCSTSCCKTTWKRIFPFISTFETYNAGAFAYDAMAGLTIGIMHIPQGMAYAMLASLPAYYGLYVSFFPPLIYFFFGKSRHASLGAFSVISLMVGNMVDGVCGSGASDDLIGDGGATTVSLLGTTETAFSSSPGVKDELFECQLGVATAGTFLAGLVQIVLSLLCLGVITVYLSEPLTCGFTTGAGIHVVSSQLKHVFGVEIPRYSGPLKLVYTYRDVILKIPETNPAAFITAVVSMAIMWITKEYLNPPFKRRFKVPIPVELLVVVFGTLASAVGQFSERFHLTTVGYIPLGLPAPKFPNPQYFSPVIGDAISLAIVSYAMSISIARVFAKRRNYEIQDNQELLAYGITNAVSANFNCFMSCVSLSRSLVLDNIGVRTQMAGLVSSGLLLIILMAVADLFEALPQSVLAAIIIVAVKGIFLQFSDIKKYWHMSKVDLSVWVVTFVAVVLLDNTLGLLVGVAWSLVTVVGRTHRPYTSLLMRAPGTDLYADAKTYNMLEDTQGVKIFRIEGSLYFANTAYVQAALYHRTQCDPKLIRSKQNKALRRIKKQTMQRNRLLEKLAVERKDKGLPTPTWGDLPPLPPPTPSPQPPMHHVVLDCSSVAWMDTQGVGMVTTVVSEYKQIGVTCLLAGCKGLVRQCLENGGFFLRHKKNLLFATVHDAVLASTHMKLQPHHDALDQYIASLGCGEAHINTGFDESADDADDSDCDSDLESLLSSDTMMTHL